MALIDQVNELSGAVDAALAAKDRDAEQTVADLTAANNTIASLNAQIQVANDAIVALKKKLAASGLTS